MKKIIFIFLLIAAQKEAIAQNHYITKYVVPQKANNRVVSRRLPALPAPKELYLDKAIFFTLPASGGRLQVNGNPVLNMETALRMPVQIAADVSFSDLMENRLNTIKNGLVIGYDDHIAELFVDAPSLFKMTCTIPF